MDCILTLRASKLFSNLLSNLSVTMDVPYLDVRRA
nr:MAG TPA: hypothetical protein [Caudoviricetes sp.]